MSNTPSDEEILALAQQHLKAFAQFSLGEVWFEGEVEFARAVLAKWGSPQQEVQEPVTWESTTPGYIKYITQARYEKFSPAVRRWYKPYRCSGCSERGAVFDACDMATATPQPAPDCHHRPPCDECAEFAAREGKV